MPWKWHTDVNIAADVMNKYNQGRPRGTGGVTSALGEDLQTAKTYGSVAGPERTSSSMRSRRSLLKRVGTGSSRSHEADNCQNLAWDLATSVLALMCQQDDMCMPSIARQPPNGISCHLRT